VTRATRRVSGLKVAAVVARVVALWGLLAMLGMLSGCGQGSGPVGPPPPPEPLRAVWVEGEAVHLEEALAELRAALPELAIHRGQGPRQIRVRVDAAAVHAQNPLWVGMADPHACVCTGEGSVVLARADAPRALVLHELVHLFGLLHTQEIQSLMHPTVDVRARLGADDVARMRAAVAVDADQAARY
jgi:hypothetical protein